MEGLGNRVQLVIAGQSAPCEGFATGTGNSVVNCVPHLLFDRDQGAITLHRPKGGTGASSVGVGEVGRWSCGTAANAPSSSRRYCRKWASTSLAGLASALRKCN